MNSGSEGRRREYHFTARDGNICSQETMINGKLVNLRDVENINELAEEKNAGTVIHLHPFSYAFFEYFEASLNCCSKYTSHNR